MYGFHRILVASHTAEADPQLARIAERFRSATGDKAEIRVVHFPEKDVLDEVLHAAEDYHADLIVMGGSTHLLAPKVSMVAHCSVLMVPDNDWGIRAAQGEGTGVLAPVDFSESSREALRTAAWLAERESEQLHCVTIETEESPWHALRTDAEEKIEHQHKIEALDAFVKETTAFRAQLAAEPVSRTGALPDHPGLSFAHAIQGADVAATIEKAAKDRNCELIVLGTRGRTRSTAILLGSVAEKVVQFAKRPVLVVKRRGHNLGLFEFLRGGGAKKA